MNNLVFHFRRLRMMLYRNITSPVLLDAVEDMNLTEPDALHWVFAWRKLLIVYSPTLKPGRDDATGQRPR